MESSWPRDQSGPALEVLVHFRRGESNAHCVPLAISAAFEACSCEEAIIHPFMSSYDARFPDSPASMDGPFAFLRVQYWTGPRGSAAVSLARVAQPRSWAQC